MKLYYSISEVAKLLEVSNSQLRYWETEFPSIRPNKNRQGDRRYTIKDIDQIKKVKALLKEKGYTIDGAKKALKEKKPDLKSIVKKLEQIRTDLSKLKEEL